MIKLFFLLLTLTSCAHMKNGYHIQKTGFANYDAISKSYGIPAQRIKEANNDKELKDLDWVFIPRRVGFLGYWQMQQDNRADEAVVADDQRDSKDNTKKVIASPRDVKLNLLWPVPAAPLLSSKYGMRGKRMHRGVDIPAPTGTQIVAAESGKVIYSNNKISGYGNMIILAHENDYLTIYAHNSKNLFKEGDYVRRSDVIALVGRTGRATGPHLHFEVRKNDVSLNPMKFLTIPAKKKRELASNKNNTH